MEDNKKTSEKFQQNEFIVGLKDGMPIALGYLPVSFTFGFMAVSGGMPVWLAMLISLTNLTSAGQFAGTKLILSGVSYFELGLTTFIINLRYMLMSFALSQKVDRNVPTYQRMLWAFGITDETFVVSCTHKENISSKYMFGLECMPILGWNIGTLLGGCITGILPVALQCAMGIALYAMFIALIVPAARESRNVLIVVIFAVLCTCALRYIPIFRGISPGFRIIISTVVAAGSGALLFPTEQEETEYENADQ